MSDLDVYTNILIPAETHDRANALAASRGISYDELISQAIDRYPTDPAIDQVRHTATYTPPGPWHRLATWWRNLP